MTQVLSCEVTNPSELRPAERIDLFSFRATLPLLIPSSIANFDASGESASVS